MCEIESLDLGPSRQQFCSLTQLDLAHNQLEPGQIPALGRLPVLQVLNLSHNHLAQAPSWPSGGQPWQVPSFELLDQLEELDLSHNKLGTSVMVQLACAPR